LNHSYENCIFFNFASKSLSLAQKSLRRVRKFIRLRALHFLTFDTAAMQILKCNFAFEIAKKTIGFSAKVHFFAREGAGVRKKDSVFGRGGGRRVPRLECTPPVTLDALALDRRASIGRRRSCLGRGCEQSWGADDDEFRPRKMEADDEMNDEMVRCAMHYEGSDGTRKTLHYRAKNQVRCISAMQKCTPPHHGGRQNTRGGGVAPLFRQSCPLAKTISAEPANSSCARNGGVRERKSSAFFVNFWPA